MIRYMLTRYEQWKAGKTKGASLPESVQTSVEAVHELPPGAQPTAQGSEEAGDGDPSYGFEIDAEFEENDE